MDKDLPRVGRPVRREKAFPGWRTLSRGQPPAAYVMVWPAYSIGTGEASVYGVMFGILLSCGMTLGTVPSFVTIVQTG